jgi:hypothetical protein
MESSGTGEERCPLSAMYDRVVSVLASRRAAKVVHTVRGQAEQSYRDFLTRIS